MTQSEPTVFVVDDDSAVLSSLKLLLKSVGMNTETYLSAQEFLDSYDPDRPGCLVLDIRMPGMSGLELQEMLQKKKIEVPIIFITGHGDVQMAVHTLKKGAIDFIEKPFNDQVLLDRIQKALAEVNQIRQKQIERKTVERNLASLTSREREVMDLVIAGKLNKVIARQLELSQKTVEFHRANVMKKMKVDSVAELVAIAVHAGIE